jgi:nitroimidazol reductase NimA-like FMN-containing flavoprotein (pyridoxamine 5'-phosphate oxidase superfamily)
MAADLASVTRFIPGEVVEYLRHHHVITLSTSSFTGIPHADTVIYVNDSRAICFFVGEGTKMLRNIKDSRYVSFTIDDYTVDWRKLRELQGVGKCRPTTRDEDAAVWSTYLSKFGPGSTRPPGVMHAVFPSEMHFVDYDYAVVTGQSAQVRSRVFQIEDAPPPPSRGAVATDLDRLTYEPGAIIFRPGQSKGAYYVVVEGEVEIRGEGHGADQTVVRLGPGQFFGDQATLRGQQGALTCLAVTHTVLLAVDRTSLRDLLDAGAA